MLPFGYTVFLQSPLSLTVLSDNIYIYIFFVSLFFLFFLLFFFVYTTCETHFCVCAFFCFVLFCFLFFVCQLYPLHFLQKKKKKKKLYGIIVRVHGTVIAG